MKVRPNPRYEVFLAELKQKKRIFSPWQGIAFRASALEFARAVRLLDGLGSFRTGGRWSAAGSFRAVNMSLTQETALRESGANFTYYNLAARDVRPKLLVGIRLSLEKVIDLTKSRGVGKTKWLALDQLLAENWRKINDGGHEAQSQAFGRAAHDIGAQAIIAPSAQENRGINLVYFPDSLPKQNAIEILGEEDLKRWLKKF